MLLSILLIWTLSWNKQVDETNNISKTEIHKEDIPICKSYEIENLYGKWIFENANQELKEGKLLLNKDKRFLLSGWRDENFKSSGSWKIEDSILELTFEDNYEFWDWYLDRIVDDFDDVIDINVKEHKVYLKIITSENSHPNKCFLYLNLFGWVFRHEYEKI